MMKTPARPMTSGVASLTFDIRRCTWGDLGFDRSWAFPSNEVKDQMHPMGVQSGSRLGPRGLASIELLVVIRVKEHLGSRFPGNIEGIVRGFDAEWGVTW
jgi:hypothetical protein